MATLLAFEAAASVTQPIYLDTAELAQIIRHDLKRAFPGVAFRVKTSRYSGGSSVRVYWTDGPIAAAVDAVVGRYKCEGFDGMTDSRTNSGPMTLDDGRVVRIHAFIFTHREVSPALTARVDAYLERHRLGEGWTPYTIEQRRWRHLGAAFVTPQGHLAFVRERL